MTKDDEILASIEINPSTPVKRTVIWLHGLGADGNDFAPFVPLLGLPEDAGVRFIFPHAPVMPITINNGYEMRAWYDISSFSLETNIDIENIRKSISLVEKLIAKEVAQGIPTTNIMLGGFSQGAVIALIAGLCYPKSLAGAVALSGYLPFAQETLQEASAANRSLPIFMAHGKFDPIVPYRLGEDAYQVLKQANYPITWYSYPIPHTVLPEELRDLSNWLQTVWS